jgi:hypothetical protein
MRRRLFTLLSVLSAAALLAVAAARVATACGWEADVWASGLPPPSSACGRRPLALYDLGERHPNGLIVKAYLPFPATLVSPGHFSDVNGVNAWEDQVSDADMAEPYGQCLGFAWQGVTERDDVFTDGGRDMHTFSPGRTHLLYVPFWYPAAAAAVLPACWAAGAARRSRRTAAGRCMACGYDLRASPDRCPECGAEPSGRASIRP